MKAGFPHYTMNIQCDCTLQEAAYRISKAAENPDSHLRIARIYHTDDQHISLSTSTGSIVYRNSYMPVVNIRLKEEESKTLVSAIFELKKGTKVVAAVLAAFMLLFEAVMLVYWKTDELVASGLLLLPIGMLVMNYAVCAAGLYFSSKNIMEILRTALNDPKRRS